MKGFLILALMAAALFAVAFPTHATASTNYDYEQYTIDSTESTIDADESGGVLFRESSTFASINELNQPIADDKHDASVIDDFAIWYPGKYLRARRANARASGGWYFGRGLQRVFGAARAGSC